MVHVKYIPIHTWYVTVPGKTDHFVIISDFEILIPTLQQRRQTFFRPVREHRYHVCRHCWSVDTAHNNLRREPKLA